MEIHWEKKTTAKDKTQVFLSKTIYGFFITKGAIVYFFKMIFIVNSPHPGVIKIFFNFKV